LHTALDLLVTYCFLMLLQTYAHRFLLGFFANAGENIPHGMMYGVTLSTYVTPTELLQSVQYELIISAVPLMELKFREMR
jgi:hypothetical protein